MKITNKKYKATRKKSRKRIVIVTISVVICISLLLFGLSVYGKAQISKVPSLSFNATLEYMTKDTADAVITVGIIKDGQASYTVYGENGKELPQALHTYEIGSLTKTFTAAMISKAEQEGKIELHATIDQYLTLPDGNTYPTIEKLLTHTSGYKPYYFESPMVSNFFTGKNDFCGITKDMVVHKAGTLNLSKENYKFNYSNYGYAILGMVLESVYNSDYTSIVNEFASNELNLSNTKISDQSGDLGKYWDWNSDDAYLAAGGITSNINDMLAYAKLQLDEYDYFAACHKSLEKINAFLEQYKLMEINMDEIGRAWVIDNENGIVWHNGGTGEYNSYLGFNPKTDVAVVVLSNLPPGYRIPATVLGVKELIEIGND